MISVWDREETRVCSVCIERRWRKREERKKEGSERERERGGMPDESEWYARSGARSLSSSFVLSLRPGPTHYPPSLESIYPRPRPADRADPIPSLPPSLSLRRGTRWRNRKINNPSLSRRRVPDSTSRLSENPRDSPSDSYAQTLSPLPSRPVTN